MEARYDALLIDPNVEKRMRLKQATLELPAFSNIAMSNTLDEAIRKFENKERFDLIFLSYSFEQSELLPFITHVKRTQGGQDSAFVLVLDPTKQNSQTTANGLIAGADGFLCEPYSVDLLWKMCQLASDVKLKRGRERKQTAVTFVLRDALHLLDRITVLKKLGSAVDGLMRQFREVGQTLKELYTDLTETYFETFTKVSKEIKVFKLDHVPKSVRVRKKLEEQARQEIEKSSSDATLGDCPRVIVKAT